MKFYWTNSSNRISSC